MYQCEPKVISKTEAPSHHVGLFPTEEGCWWAVLFISEHSSTTQEHGPYEILTAGGVGDKELEVGHYLSH